MTKPTKRSFSFEFKLDAVRRFLAGESKVALAKELQLSSPELIEKWARQYRNEGETVCARSRRAARRQSPGDCEQAGIGAGAAAPENERLRAEVAFLGKVRALRDEERR